MDRASLLSGTHKARDVLSISSHVVHGKVGNDAIQFPLNLRGWNVDCIHTTNLSNHPGYRQFRGAATDPQVIKNIYNGLSHIEVRYDAAIVGYVASKEILKAVYRGILKRLPEDTVVVLDPILGDNDKLYVDEELVPMYKRILRDESCGKLVNVVTPNQFEIETLTDVEIVDMKSLKRALRHFFRMYKVKNVVITSVSFEGQSGYVLCVGAKSNGEMYLIRGTQIDAVFSGSGDLFLGILTDRFVKSGGDLLASLRHTMTVVSKVLEATYEMNRRKKSSKRRYIGDKLYIPDLKLIESRTFLKDEEIDDLDALTEVTSFE